MLIFLGVLLILVFAAVFIAYRESGRIVYRKHKRYPIESFPCDFGANFEDAEFKNKDNILLKGWFLRADKPSDKTIIFLHGWGMNKGGVLKNTVFLKDHGFNLFYFDFRGSGESGEGVSSIGYLEIRDAEAAIEYVKKRYPKETKNMGIYGISMGGAVAVYEAAYNKNIKCIVAEGCYYSYEKVVSRWARIHKKMPYFPMVALTLFFARKKLGMNPESFSPKHNIKRLQGKPIFLINGSDDTLAPRHDARKLYSKARDPKLLWIVANASHTKSAEVAGQQYKNRLAEFFTKYL